MDLQQEVQVGGADGVVPGHPPLQHAQRRRPLEGRREDRRREARVQPWPQPRNSQIAKRCQNS